MTIPIQTNVGQGYVRVYDANGDTESSSMIPLMRLYTAGGYCLQTKSDDVRKYVIGTHLVCNRSNNATAFSRFPLPSSARNIASHVDGYK